MEFRDLKRQYVHIKDRIDENLQSVVDNASFIGGHMVERLEHDLASYVSVKHCITCANGTDALQLALMAWGVGEGDAVLVPDFTFFASGEVVSAVGAVPVFVDVRQETFNIDVSSLEEQIRLIYSKSRLTPKAVVAVDLFGQPAEYDAIRKIADKYGLLVLEDGAQGFGGTIDGRRACSFGDIAATSFFPAKPLGCYGDGGAIFTGNDEWAERIRSLKVHGKGESKYDNVRIGMNSRLDTMQAAVLAAKFPVFATEEIVKVQAIAATYTERLKDVAQTPAVPRNYMSSWAQYTIQLPNQQVRDGLRKHLACEGIPSMVYYQKPMHLQKAFDDNGYEYEHDMYPVTNALCETVLSLPFHPYMEDEEIGMLCEKIVEYF